MRCDSSLAGRPSTRSALPELSYWKRGRPPSPREPLRGSVGRPATTTAHKRRYRSATRAAKPRRRRSAILPWFTGLRVRRRSDSHMGSSHSRERPLSRARPPLARACASVPSGRGSLGASDPSVCHGLRDLQRGCDRELRMRASNAVRLAVTPQVPGMRCPTAWGHRFGSRLCCEWCATTWDAHQLEPRPCPRPPEIRAEDAKALRGRAAPELHAVAARTAAGLASRESVS